MSGYRIRLAHEGTVLPPGEVAGRERLERFLADGVRDYAERRNQPATEGTSHVTVYTPAVGDWNLRRATATIYWVDAQWIFPASAVVEPNSLRVPLRSERFA